MVLRGGWNLVADDRSTGLMRHFDNFHRPRRCDITNRMAMRHPLMSKGMAPNLCVIPGLFAIAGLSAQRGPCSKTIGNCRPLFTEICQNQAMHKIWNAPLIFSQHSKGRVLWCFTFMLKRFHAFHFCSHRRGRPRSHHHGIGSLEPIISDI